MYYSSAKNDVAEGDVGPPMTKSLQHSDRFVVNTCIVVVHENDVLFGRGGRNSKHSGNKRLRAMARARKNDYNRATKKEKSEISRSIVSYIRSLQPPGRFLKKDNESGHWTDVGDDMAKEKTSQALRDAEPDGGLSPPPQTINNNSTSAKTINAFQTTAHVEQSSFSLETSLQGMTTVLECGQYASNTSTTIDVIYPAGRDGGEEGCVINTVTPTWDNAGEEGCAINTVTPNWDNALKDENLVCDAPVMVPKTLSSAKTDSSGLHNQHYQNGRQQYHHRSYQPRDYSSSSPFADAPLLDVGNTAPKHACPFGVDRLQDNRRRRRRRVPTSGGECETCFNDTSPKKLHPPALPSSSTSSLWADHDTGLRCDGKGVKSKSSPALHRPSYPDFGSSRMSCSDASLCCNEIPHPTAYREKTFASSFSSGDPISSGTEREDERFAPCKRHSPLRTKRRRHPLFHETHAADPYRTHADPQPNQRREHMDNPDNDEFAEYALPSSLQSSARHGPTPTTMMTVTTVRTPCSGVHHLPATSGNSSSSSVGYRRAPAVTPTVGCGGAGVSDVTKSKNSYHYRRTPKDGNVHRNYTSPLSQQQHEHLSKRPQEHLCPSGSSRRRQWYPSSSLPCTPWCLPGDDPNEDMSDFDLFDGHLVNDFGVTVGTSTGTGAD